MAVLGFLVVAALVGFVVLPTVQGRAAGIDPYSAICRALGIAPGAPSAVTPAVTTPAVPVSQVTWSDATRALLRGSGAGAGEAVAQSTCIACHAKDGSAADPMTMPSLAGQTAPAIYKELSDYRSGARTHPIMSAMAATLTEPQVAQVAAYYSSLVRRPVDERARAVLPRQEEYLVTQGDPARRIAPCAACHAASAGGPIEAPSLNGQYESYLAIQMRAFAAGTRHNDLFARMRVLSARLTDAEIQRLARYYAAAR